MGLMVYDKKYKCIKGPIYVRKAPDDYAQAISVVRKGQVVHAEYVMPGLLFHADGSDPTPVDHIWIKFEKGYVRFQSMRGTYKYFEECMEFEDYPSLDPKTAKHNDLVMLRKGALDAYSRPLPEQEYEPKIHRLCLFDSSHQLALLGYPKGIQTWVWTKDLKLISHSDDPNFSEDTVDLGN